MQAMTELVLMFLSAVDDMLSTSWNSEPTEFSLPLHDITVISGQMSLLHLEPLEAMTPSDLYHGAPAFVVQVARTVFQNQAIETFELHARHTQHYIDIACGQYQVCSDPRVYQAWHEGSNNMIKTGK